MTVIVDLPLEQPIIRGETRIETLQLRKPDSGELRGLSLAQLGAMNVDELRKLAPRITLPTITPAEFDAMDPADLMEFADKVTDFLLTKARRATLPTT